MSCNRRATTHIYLTPTDGSAGKVFPADIFGLPNVKIDRKKNTVTIKGKEYSLQNMEEIKDGRYNDFLQQKQFMQTAKQQINSQNNQQIEQVKREIQEAKQETSQKIEEAKNEVKGEVTRQTEEKITAAKREVIANTETKITEAKEAVKNEVTATCTVKIQEAKNEITNQRAQEIQQAKAELAAQIQNASSSSSFSIGDYKHSAQAIDHNGWLLCDGRAISRNKYAALFNIIGPQFGQGDRSTTFNLPNAQGRVSVAEGQKANYPMAETGGQNFITLTTAQLPPHAHQVQPHSHTLTTVTVGGAKAKLGDSWANDRAVNNWNYHGTTHRGGNVWTTNSGSGSPIDVKQPYIVIGRLFIFSGIIEN